MADVRGKYVAPSIRLTAFSCPHCGTLTKQRWSAVYLQSLSEEPVVWMADEVGPAIERLKKADTSRDDDDRKVFINSQRERLDRMASGALLVSEDNKFGNSHLVNLNTSRCDECGKFSLWIHTRLLWPESFEAPLPSPDMPELVQKDYDEAAAVYRISPKSSAALLRLAIQRLCRVLGEDGDNINADIGALVRKGLAPEVQKALDIVRVTGNSAVHPGKMSDDDVADVAHRLFGLVNIICEYMITRPKHLQELFSALPQGAQEQIAKRDAGKP